MEMVFCSVDLLHISAACRSDSPLLRPRKLFLVYHIDSKRKKLENSKSVSMVEATVSMVLNRLAPMIERTVRQEVCLLINSNDEANELSSKLKRIHEVLRDAEQKGVRDPRVKNWLDKLQEISYEIDDVLDIWDWENFKLQSDSSSTFDRWQKVSYFIKSIYLCFRRPVQLRNIRLNIKKLHEKLDVIGKENEDEFKFLPNLGPNSQDFKRVSTTSFVDVREVHGRDDDKETLMSKLLSESCSGMYNNSTQVRKTTLAQLLYNDDKIKNHFQVRMWVCVSNPFDEIKIAKAILEALNDSSPNISEFEALLQHLVANISGKNFLLVLDDIWAEDDRNWIPLKISLNYGAPSSRILVTTRKKKVAEMIGSTEMQMLSLEPLSDSYCWSVLSQIAFHGRGEWERRILEETGLEIVKKCKGLPLAAKSIGSLLHFKPSLEEWRQVLASQVWELEIAGTDIFPSLVLSYDELHPAVKRCFSYCAIFPKNTEIEVDTLIRIWCCQGFLSSEGSSDDMELRGREFFNDLAMRSFFQDFVKEDMGTQILYCKMHDIIHDFAQFLTKNECLIVENIDVGARLACNQNVHHLTVIDNWRANTKNPVLIYQEKCRSLLSTKCAISTNSFSHLKRVRMLVLDGCGLEAIPGEIGNLIRLRYLDLSENPIEKLPETVCNLFRLQTLKLKWCRNLSGLPQRICKLRSLRHLLNQFTSFEFPEGIQELTNLRTLSEINVTHKNWKKLGFLRNLNKLHGDLRIVLKDLDGADAVATTERADLKKKIFIRKLALFYSGKIHSQVVEALQPHPNLEILDFRGLYLPKWLATLTNLRKLSIIGDDDNHPEMGGLSSLPPLGKLMPFLEVLSLRRMPGMERLSREFLGTHIEAATSQATQPPAFPRLKLLRLSGCEKWIEWEDISEEEENNINISIFPYLEYMELFNCPELKALPIRILRKASSLKRLLVGIECKYLYQLYISPTAQDRDKISNIPQVYFY